MKFLTTDPTDPINETDPDFFYFIDMDQKIPPDPIGPDYTKFVEVGVEWKSYSQYLGVQRK